MTGYEIPPLQPDYLNGVQLSEQTFIRKHGISPVAFAFLALIGVFILYQFVGGLIILMVFGFKPDAGNVLGFRLANGVGELLFILVPATLLTRLASSDAKEFLRVRRASLGTLVLPLVGIFSLQQLLQMYLFFQEKIPLPQSIAPYVQQFKDLIEETMKLLVTARSIPELILVIIVIALIPALTEEFMFRGLVQRSFEQGLGPRKSILLTGIIFGVYHLNPFSIVPLVLLGVYLGFLVFRANSIVVSIAAHFYNNAIACVAAYIQRDDYLVTGNPNEMSIGYLTGNAVIFLLLFGISTFYFIQITRRQTPEADFTGVQP